MTPREAITQHLIEKGWICNGTFNNTTTNYQGIVETNGTMWKREAKNKSSTIHLYEDILILTLCCTAKYEFSTYKVEYSDPMIFEVIDLAYDS